MAKSNIITEQEIFFDTPLQDEEKDLHFSVPNQHNGAPLKAILAEVERDIISASLKKHHGNVA